MEFFSIIYFSGAVIFSFMTLFFILAIIVKDNSIIDITWGLGFIVTSLAALIYYSSYGLLQITVVSIVAVWGIRLAVRIAKRNIGKGEDWRYKKWREDWGKHFLLRSYFQIFILQGFIMLLNLFPVLVIISSKQSSLGIFYFVGLSIWVIGFLFESIGDYQLNKFIKNPANANTIIDEGLWRYTRHPNYFGESLMWWGIFLIALSVPGGWIGLIGPLTITLMIRFVSGVPMTERGMENIPGFKEYKKTTNVFVPWFRKF